MVSRMQRPDMLAFANQIHITLGSEFDGFKLNELREAINVDYSVWPEKKAKELGFESFQQLLECREMVDKFVLIQIVRSADGAEVSRIYKARPDDSNRKFVEMQRRGKMEAIKEQKKKERMNRELYGAMASNGVPTRDGVVRNHFQGRSDPKQTGGGPAPAVGISHGGGGAGGGREHHWSAPTNYGNAPVPVPMAPQPQERIPAPSLLSDKLYYKGPAEPEGLDDYYDEMNEEEEQQGRECPAFNSTGGRRSGVFVEEKKKPPNQSSSGGNSSSTKSSATGESAKVKGPSPPSKPEESATTRGPNWRTFDVSFASKPTQSGSFQQPKPQAKEKVVLAGSISSGGVGGSSEGEGRDIWREEDQEEDDDDYQTVVGEELQQDVDDGGLPALPARAPPPPDPPAFPNPSTAQSIRRSAPKSRRNIPEAVLIDLGTSSFSPAASKPSGSGVPPTSVPVAPASSSSSSSSSAIPHFELPNSSVDFEVLPGEGEGEAVHLHPDRLSPSECVLLVCDLQEGFRSHTGYFPEIVTVTRRMIQAANLLGMKVIASEQNLRSLGRTVPELELCKHDVPVFGRAKFSMCTPALRRAIPNGTKSVLLCGIEAHVSVLQTALDLQAEGLSVHVLVDATSSRSMLNRKVAYKQMERARIILTTSECAILGLVGSTAHEKFKAVQKLIREDVPDTGLLGNALNF